MAKPTRKANRIHQQVLGALIETKQVTWQRKTLGKNGDGKEVVNTAQVANEVLRFPLAQNVSDENIERMARRWVP